LDCGKTSPKVDLAHRELVLAGEENALGGTAGGWLHAGASNAVRALYEELTKTQRREGIRKRKGRKGRKGRAKNVIVWDIQVARDVV
jgi:hypothetical protein